MIDTVTYSISDIEENIKQLVGFRGTKIEIVAKLNNLGPRHDCFLEAFEDPLPGIDLSFNTNLGMIGDHYLDFEIYMLPTRKLDEFMITEVTPF